MPNPVYIGARNPGDWYYGAKPEGPIWLGASNFLAGDPNTGGGNLVTMEWLFNSLTGPLPNVGGGQATPLYFGGDAAQSWGSDGRVLLPKGTWLQSDPMEWTLTETGDAHTTQAPKRFGMAVRGTFQWPQLVMEYFRWNTSRISFYRSWSGNALRADVYRDSTDSPFTNVMNSPYNEAIAIGSLQTWGFEYVDLPGEAGGSVQFYIDDAPVGAPWGTTGKMRVEPGERLYVNASLGNGSNGDNCELEWIKVWYEV